MNDQLELNNIVLQAQRGEKQALDRLAELSLDPLRVYVYRMTLEEELTAEIVQETMLEMCRVIGKLKNNERFLPWLYGIATNKLRHFYRNRSTDKRAKEMRTNREPSQEHHNEGLENLITIELKDLVKEAISGLKDRHRSVLIMRCYDGLSYADIAESLNCSEFGCRMLFLRAKRALQKKLAKHGLQKSALLGILAFFGKMTAPSKAAAAQISISNSTMHVGLAATTVGFATTKTGVISLLTAGSLALGTAVLSVNNNLNTDIPAGGDISNTSALINSDISNEQKHYQKQWYFLPDGPSGALLFRSQLDNLDNSSELIILQNQNGNYTYNSHIGSVTLLNARWYSRDLYTLRLPTDSPDMLEFLSSMDHYTPSFQPIHNSEKNLLIKMIYSKSNQVFETATSINPNAWEEDYFQMSMSEITSLDDQRDVIHKRGWCYFTIDGAINGDNIEGSGRYPIYLKNHYKQYPWISLSINNISISDGKNGAYIYNKNNGTIDRFQQGTFFSGMGRPWLGIHCIDMVRREAALLKLPFQTSDNLDGSASITIHADADYQLIFDCDLNNDFIRRITIQNNRQRIGYLAFNYLSESVLKNRSSSEPDMIFSRRSKTEQQSPGLLWLVQLAKGIYLEP